MSGIVIIGGGLAGDTAAATLRDIGFAGSVTLVSDEAHRPYDRPPLSKAALLSADAADKVFFRPEEWYRDKGIELVLGDGAASIDRQERRVVLASGRTLSYDKLLIATGTRARRLRLLENLGAPVFYLRTLGESQALRQALQPGASIVLIGAGVIGLEVAASAATLGCAVTVIEVAERVMARSVSPSVSEFIAAYHRAKGVRVICGARISGVAAEAGRAVLTLDGGERLVADALVAGIGAEPVTELAQAAGLRVDDGIVVDRFTRTSDPDIHAAGDVTRFESIAFRRSWRTEHWRHAMDQAAVAARVMAGQDTAYEDKPWVWSDQYDLNIQITGEGIGEAEVIRGNPSEARFIAFQLRKGRLSGAISVNQPRFKRPIEELVVARAEVDPAVLADAAADLKKLAAR
ncbi:MAG TPA: FAD-dependent oxidoreductase [Caulobacteraceae bacterium]|nr:FAD-dependent oxidoreductase [Caulobacteraceae bacterium]